MNIQIVKLDRPEYSGDWHDRPNRYAVIGPAEELQKFPSKKEAEKYMRIRKNYRHRGTAYQLAAIREFSSRI